MVSWGHPRYTGVQHQLRGVTAISANDGAFAALLEDGGVVTWGDPIFKSAEARAYDMFFHCFLFFLSDNTKMLRLGLVFVSNCKEMLPRRCRCDVAFITVPADQLHLSEDCCSTVYSCIFLPEFKMW